VPSTNAIFFLFPWIFSIRSSHCKSLVSPFRARFTLEIGTQLDITLQVGDSILLATGEVVTCDRTVGNGIRFTRMLPDDSEELDRLLQAVEAQQKGGVP
jgi:hypothetical protein